MTVGTLGIDQTLVCFDFLYGLASFVLGLAVALQSRKRSRLALAGYLGWLGAFGITHALSEWGNVFIPLQATYFSPRALVALRVVQTLLLALSYLLLFQFGAMAAVADSRWRTLLRALPVIATGVWLAVFVLSGGPDAANLAEAEAWARRLLAFPGAVLAGWGMLCQAGEVESFQPRRIARHFRLAAVLLAVYAVLAGLVVPTAAAGGAEWPSVNLPVGLLGIPITVLRSLAALGIAVSIIRGLDVFEVEAAQQLEDARRRRFEAAQHARTTLDKVSETISQRMELGRLLEAALATVLRVEQSSAGWIVLDGEEGHWDKLTLGAASGLTAELSAGRQCTCRPECACGRMSTGDTWVIATGEACGLLPSGAGPSSFSAVPLQARHRAVGVLCLASPPGGFCAEERGLLTSIGRQMGLAIDNARLMAELERKDEARRQLLQRALSAQEEERRRLALELHDETGQRLSAVILDLGAAGSMFDRDPAQAAAMVSDARELAGETLRGVRELILGLRPASLDSLGLVPALCVLADDAGRRGGVEIEVDGRALNRRLAPDTETALFRIMQEGLNNVARHASAQHATLVFELTDEEVRATLWDDGVGFDSPNVTGHSRELRGLGLLGMQERASSLGGQVVIQSARGAGTGLRVRLPLSAPHKAVAAGALGGLELGG